MQEKQLIDKGEHLVISVEKEEVYDPEIKKQFCRTIFDMQQPDLSMETRACRGVLVIAPTAPTNKNWHKFKDEVAARGKLHPFNIPDHPLIKINVREVKYSHENGAPAKT